MSQMSSRWNKNFKTYPKTEFPARVVWYSSFSQLHKIGNVDIIANFVFPYVCSFLLYLHQLLLINWKLEIKEHMRIIFQGCMLYWTSWFLIAELKQSWQCCHSCIREHLWKILLNNFMFYCPFVKTEQQVVLWFWQWKPRTWLFCCFWHDVTHLDTDQLKPHPECLWGEEIGVFTRRKSDRSVTSDSNKFSF